MPLIEVRDLSLEFAAPAGTVRVPPLLEYMRITWSFYSKIKCFILTPQIY